MCEALIRVIDKTNPNDPYLDCKNFKRGDIVTLQDDGWPWTQAELTNSNWRIIKFTSIPLIQATTYLNDEKDTDPAHPSRMLRRRLYAFDLMNVALPLAFRTWLQDATRAAPTRSINLTGAQLVNYMIQKTPLADPNVMG